MCVCVCYSAMDTYLCKIMGSLRPAELKKYVHVVLKKNLYFHDYCEWIVKDLSWSLKAQFPCKLLFVRWELYFWNGKQNLSDNYCHIPGGVCDYQNGHLSLNFVLGWRGPACKEDHQLCSQGTALPKNGLLPSAARDPSWRDPVIFWLALKG